MHLEAWHVREEVFSDVYYRLAMFFAKGKEPKGKLSSLAFAIAYRVAIGTYRRPRAYKTKRVDEPEQIEGI